MFGEHAQNYLDTIAWLQRLPAMEMQGVGGNGEPPMPEPVADLIRDWRRMRHQDLPEAMCEGLARCDENTLFNIVNRCLDLLLRRIVPKYDRKRQRRREKRERRRARAVDQTADALVGAFGGAEAAPVHTEAGGPGQSTSGAGCGRALVGEPPVAPDGGAPAQT